MSDKKQHWHVAIVKRDNRLKVNWVRRAGTHKALMPCDLPEHVAQFLTCDGDSEGWMDTDLTLDDLLAEGGRFEPFKLNDDPNGIAGTIRIDAPEEEKPLWPIKRLVSDLANELGADTLGEIYRRVYKGTDCGPSIGFLIRNLPAEHDARKGASWREGDGEVWLYCDDLYKLPTIEEMGTLGWEIIGVSISSIVEGSDVEIDGDQLCSSNYHKLPKLKDFWTCVEEVNAQASFYWERDNSHWYCVRDKDGDQYGFHETWGELVWTYDDEYPPKEVKAAVEQFVKDGGNMTWNESIGTQTHPYGKYFPLPGAEGWEVCEWLNDSTY
jgi:hypothetical protein